jgi:hypothetical protein
MTNDASLSRSSRSRWNTAVPVNFSEAAKALADQSSSHYPPLEMVNYSFSILFHLTAGSVLANDATPEGHCSVELFRSVSVA